MPFDVTALQDVRILAYMRNAPPPAREVPTWVPIRKGQTVRTGMVTGIHPSFLPNEIPTHCDGDPPVVLLPSYGPESFPKDFFGLIHMEFIEGKSGGASR